MPGCTASVVSATFNKALGWQCHHVISKAHSVLYTFTLSFSSISETASQRRCMSASPPCYDLEGAQKRPHPLSLSHRRIQGSPPLFIVNNSPQSHLGVTCGMRLGKAVSCEFLGVFQEIKLFLPILCPRFQFLKNCWRVVVSVFFLFLTPPAPDNDV